MCNDKTIRNRYTLTKSCRKNWYDKCFVEYTHVKISYKLLVIGIERECFSILYKTSKRTDVEITKMHFIFNTKFWLNMKLKTLNQKICFPPLLQPMHWFDFCKWINWWHSLIMKWLQNQYIKFILITFFNLILYVICCNFCILKYG